MTRPPIEYLTERLEAFGEPGKTTIAALIAYVKELEAHLKVAEIQRDGAFKQLRSMGAHLHD